jgi:diaminopropionate ammonia-lyase
MIEPIRTEHLDFVVNSMKNPLIQPPQELSPDAARRVLKFHRHWPGYAPTPLAELRRLASRLGLKGIFVKDESRRFGLNAFKCLGGTYAVGRKLAELAGLDPDRTGYDELIAPAVRERAGHPVFATATDGNHGRGVAWAARSLGCPAVIHMPKGSSEHRVQAIRDTGAEVIVTDLSYDETVVLAKAEAEEKGRILVQDSSFPGYERIATWVLQGYLTLAEEAALAMELVGAARPTHVILQSGVGTMPAALAGYFTWRWRERPPIILIAEPRGAACFFESLRFADGAAHPVELHPSMMAGLSCGVLSSQAWEILRPCAFGALACDDEAAALGMRILANPLPGDPFVLSGESGAVGMGLIHRLATLPDLAPIREAIHLTPGSTVLLISTEGDTDPENWRKVVWGA